MMSFGTFFCLHFLATKQGKSNFSIHFPYFLSTSEEPNRPSEKNIIIQNPNNKPIENSSSLSFFFLFCYFFNVVFSEFRVDRRRSPPSIWSITSSTKAKSFPSRGENEGLICVWIGLALSRILERHQSGVGNIVDI